jgi:hypothetical protein
VAVHGRDEVVVISAEEFRRLNGDRPGESLIAAMRAPRQKGTIPIGPEFRRRWVPF